jgi:hypothetical protein
MGEIESGGRPVSIDVTRRSRRPVPSTGDAQFRRVEYPGNLLFVETAGGGTGGVKQFGVGASRHDRGVAATLDVVTSSGVKRLGGVAVASCLAKIFPESVSVVC